jgi:hypothetical protein
MRIRIEIDGRTVFDTNVETFAVGASLASSDEQPPEELLREARARGAQSAGRASYVPEAAAALTASVLATDRPAATIAGPRTTLDAEAGRAVAEDVTPGTRGARKSAVRTAKKKRARSR